MMKPSRLLLWSVTYLLGIYIFPWWIVVVIGLLFGIVNKFRPLKSMWINFLIIFLTVGVVCTYISFTNDHRISTLIGDLFGESGSIGGIILSATIPSIVGALAALVGGLISQIKT